MIDVPWQWQGWRPCRRETPPMRSDELIAILGLRPHPEGGWYRESWRDRGGAGSAIYFLLTDEQASEWHRVHDRAEAWHFYDGAPLLLHVAPGPAQLLGTDLLAGHRPQLVVPPGAWQRAETTGDWTLVGCTVTPAFVFEAFELAPAGWQPESGGPAPSTVGTMVTTPPTGTTPLHASPLVHNTLSIDIGGTGLKASVVDDSGTMEHDRVRIDTPYPLPPDKLVTVLADLVKSLPEYDRVSVGFPGMVRAGRVLSAPHFISPKGPGGEPAPKLVQAWTKFNLQAAISHALGKPTRVANDADLQGAGVIKGEGLELVITLGTGVGTALFYEGRLMQHLELAHHPLRKDLTYNEALGDAARKHDGTKKWNKRVAETIGVLRALTFFDHCYIGGGNSVRVDIDLPDDVTLTDNAAGITGGIKLWDATS
jgi:polyphosphate glucokinase